MSGGIDTIAGRHAALHAHTVAVLRALDDESDAVVRTEIDHFLHAVEGHLEMDFPLGYRLLAEHPAAAVRQEAQSALTIPCNLSIPYAYFAVQWREAAAGDFDREALRDHLQPLVAALMTRIASERRLAAMFSSVA